MVVRYGGGLEAGGGEAGAGAGNTNVASRTRMAELGYGLVRKKPVYQPVYPAMPTSVIGTNPPG
jgi:hypothetical protein